MVDSFHYGRIRGIKFFSNSPDFFVVFCLTYALNECNIIVERMVNENDDQNQEYSIGKLRMWKLWEIPRGNEKSPVHSMDEEGQRKTRTQYPGMLRKMRERIHRKSYEISQNQHQHRSRRYIREERMEGTMKTINEIKAEIEKIDEALETAIENYRNGIITSDTLTAQKIRFETVKNALEWVIK